MYGNSMMLRSFMNVQVEFCRAGRCFRQEVRSARRAGMSGSAFGSSFPCLAFLYDPLSAELRGRAPMRMGEDA